MLEIDGAPERRRYSHPDAVLRVCVLWSLAPRIPPATRTSGTILRYADSCRCGSSTWCPKTTSGKGRNKRVLPHPIAVCVRCGQEWGTWTEDDHLRTGVPGSGVTRRGRWTRYIHVRAPSRPHTSTEDRLFGGAFPLGEMLRLRRIKRTLEQHDTLRWASWAYFEHVLSYSHRGSGGQHALAIAGAARWPRAPVIWTRDGVRTLIRDGRAEWARRLVRAGIIAEGNWWQDDARDRERSR